MSDKLFMKTAGGFDKMAEPYQKVKATMESAASLNADVATAVLTVESRSSLSAPVISTMETLQVGFNDLFASIHDDLSATKRDRPDGRLNIPVATLEARAHGAFTAALMASDSKGAAVQNQTLQAPPSTAYGATSIVAHATGNEFHNQRTIYTAEAFQNYNLQDSRIFSALFNYSIVDFDDFTRTIWRPVTISPDTSFVELLINVLSVFDGAEHNIDGRSRNWNRHNLVRAIADHTILTTDLTQAIPSKNTSNAGLFMTKIQDKVITQANKSVTTAPLLAGAADMDYIALCMPEWLTKNGALDQRDNLDPGVRLSKLYIALADDVLEFNVDSMAGTEFNGAVQDDRQKETLNWTTASLRVDKFSKNADNTPLTNLASVVTGELVLSIRVNVHAEINLETGDLSFTTTDPVVRWLKDKDGTVIAQADARYAAIAAALKGHTETGFELKAFRSNAARRQRGQLINIRRFAEFVTVPWRDPIAAERPAHGSSEQDTSDLTALMSATRIRITNEGITAFLDAEAVLSRTSVTAEDYDSTAIPASLGAGRHYVLPYYKHSVLDMLEIVQNLKSGEKERDMQAAMVAVIRNELAVGYVESQYKAASDALSGGTAPKPKVACVTDPVTARYLIEPGELRTLVDFELVVVPVLDFRMKGKIKLVFISDDGGTDVNYLNFGYLFWSPEHVMVANMTRTAGFNRETQVQPRYRHYVACPVMISFDVLHIAEALKKLSIDINNVTPVAPAP